MIETERKSPGWCARQGEKEDANKPGIRKTGPAAKKKTLAERERLARTKIKNDPLAKW